MTGVIVLGGVYIVNEVANSLLLDQYLSERYGLLRCFQKLSTGELSDPSECGKYAKLHLPFIQSLMRKNQQNRCVLLAKIF